MLAAMLCVCSSVRKRGNEAATGVVAGVPAGLAFGARVVPSVLMPVVAACPSEYEPLGKLPLPLPLAFMGVCVRARGPCELPPSFVLIPGEVGLFTCMFMGGGMNRFGWRSAFP
jgi:hypothetical protein